LRDRSTREFAVKHVGRLPALLVITAMPLAMAQETAVQNDSVKDGDTVAIQAGFIAGESAAAWLKSPCKGHVVAVQVFWASYFGGTGPTLQDSIKVFAAGTFPTPGATLATLEAPALEDGYLNEYRYTDEAGTMPLSVAVAKNQTFVVSLKFSDSPSPIFGPSVVTDIDGCQSGKNGIFAVPGGWKNACSFGLSGDFVIRAVVNCVPPCLGDVDGDGQVNQVDLGFVLASYDRCLGQPGYVPEADFTGDGCVKQVDLGILLAQYGLPCVP
jgi:hypothetical protein